MTARPPPCLGSTGSALGLRVAVVLGSTRVHGPPEPNLGARVGKFVSRELRRRGHSVDVVDPLEEALPLLDRPHFAFRARDVPARLARLHDRLRAAQAYVCVTPEYNHAPSPALLNLLNHFGSSVFGFKPSLIVSYSAGQWGGTRAAHALRPTLSELGCLPVSAMLHVPKVGEALDPRGVAAEPAAQLRWESYAARGLGQLEWWATAAHKHRIVLDPTQASPPFVSDPSQRNAP